MDGAALTQLVVAVVMFAAQVRGKSESERERHALELALAHQSADGVRRDVERLEAELRDYKSRAQVRGTWAQAPSWCPARVVGP